MEIKNAKYLKNEDGKIVSISANIEETDCEVPINLENRHYIEIKKQLDAGTLTIKDAE